MEDYYKYIKDGKYDNNVDTNYERTDPEIYLNDNFETTNIFLDSKIGTFENKTYDNVGELDLDFNKLSLKDNSNFEINTNIGFEIDDYLKYLNNKSNIINSITTKDYIIGKNDYNINSNEYYSTTTR